MKIQWQLSGTIIFSAVFVTVGVLVGLGKLDPEWLTRLLLAAMPSLVVRTGAPTQLVVQRSDDTVN